MTDIAAHTEDDAATAGPAGPRRRRRRRRLIAAAGAVVLLAAAVAVAQAARRQPPAENGALPPHTAKVVRTSLVESQTVPGTLGYGRVTPLSTVFAGTVTSVPAEGATVGRGQTLFEVDNHPVVLMLGRLPAYRAMAPGSVGPDVAQLERNLAALGYRGMTVDNRYTASTAGAVRSWQRDAGLPRTGVIELGRVTFLPAPVRVDGVVAVAGQQIAPGATVLNYTGTTRVVSVDLDVALVPLASRGAKVSVSVPGREPVDGTVASVGAAIQEQEDGAGSDSGGQGPGGGQGDAADAPTVLVTIAVTDQRALGAVTGAPVRVNLVAQRRDDVLAVPVAALLALPGGAYGVEVVTGSTTRVVQVETGLFADGLVEISGDGLAEGDTVGTATP
jgi:peptidoglycan hydrolase-like protein with peptidoglycan-binding domain